MKAVSSWSLHRLLGSYVSGDAPGSGPTARPDGTALLDLPAELARRGYDTVQLCHFHLPARDETYVGELRSTLADSGITLDALLVDDGDLTHPTDADAHERWIDGWLDVATALGARRARVIAGKQQPDPELLRASGRRLAALAARHPDVRIVTENWLALTPGPTEVNTILDVAGDGVGLLIDLGNWTGPDKYANLEAIAGRAETCHAKCHFGVDGPDADDFAAALRVLRAAGYAGPLALVYDGSDFDEWTHLEETYAITTRVMT